jgi:Na+/H+ antiporter NhaD/arsenite permease-like protein
LSQSSAGHPDLRDDKVIMRRRSDGAILRAIRDRIVLGCLALAATLVVLGRPALADDPAAKVTITGIARDRHNEPVGDCRVTLSVDERPVARPSGGWRTGHDGLFAVEVELPREQAERGSLSLRLDKTSYRALERVQVPPLRLQPGPPPTYVSHVPVTMDRDRPPAFWVAVLVLVGIYVLIASEKMHRTLAAMLGAGVVLLVSYTAGQFDRAWFVISYEEAIRAIDWNVIFLLFGMMIIVGVLKDTGLFQWLAFRSFQLARGKVYLLAAILMMVTAVTSAFLDNVTTMLLITPVSIEICTILGLHPFALLLPEVVASNFGGTATLIGDPPNIMIGSFAGLTFNDFVKALTPVVLITMVVQIGLTKLYYGKKYAAAQMSETDLQRTVVSMETRHAIRDRKLLRLGLAVLAVVIALFFAHGALHMEVSVAALVGAAVLLALSRKNVVHLLEKDVEWPSLVFFMMLFIVVGAAANVGLLQIVADWVLRVSAGNLVYAILIIAWVSAVLSAVIDNIPFTATMLPIVAHLTKTIPGAQNMVLFWALALGACFGGNGTLVGASANIVTAGLLERTGYPLSFRAFLRYGVPVTFVSMLIVSAYLLVVLR